MKSLLVTVLAAIAAPALAQHSGHSAQPDPATSASCTPEHAAMGHCKLPPEGRQQADPHSGHGMPDAQQEQEQQPQPDPHAGHQMPAQEQPSTADPHGGHQMPAPQSPADPHAGHDMSVSPADVPVGPPPPEAFQGPENAADVAWGRAAMEPGRAVLFGEHGDLPAYKVLFDRIEAQARDGRNGYLVDAEGWYGGDIDKLWIKTEIEGDLGGKPEKAEFQALWSHAIGPWFDLQAGVRLDAEPDTRGRLVLGVQGLAPYWIEVDAAAFLSDKGDVTARFEAEHDVRITRKLVLQPRAELDFALQDIPREAIGSGLSTTELGLRLRYEFVPNFAPYIGVNYERAIGATRRFRRAEGEDAGDLSFVAGLRMWF